MPSHSDPRLGTPLPVGLHLAGLTCDSRKVKPGYLFAALPGAKVDGTAFIAQALAQGAVAILAAPGTTLPADASAILLTAPNPRLQFALMAATHYGHQPACMAAVTGTNGKTSTADFTRQIWASLGHKAASVGTLGIIAPDWENVGGLTTPDPESLHAALAELADHGVTHACVEASSHGLSQYRLDGVTLKAAAFTNLTRDHLDYHHTMEEYGQAKLRLFTEVLPPGGWAVVNADSPLSSDITATVSERGISLLSYGWAGEHIRVTQLEPVAQGQNISVSVLGRDFHLLLPLAGAFQAWNALTALGLAIACGANVDAAAAALTTLTGVPGRLQKVAERASGAAVYVDYAHTPDALDTVLTALRPHVTGEARLVVLMGCGGDRDPGKRPQMGEIAAEKANLVYVTDDNPRSEDPALIRQAIVAACPAAIEIADRRQAIRQAIADLKDHDVLVLAGKGHEQGQIVAGIVHPFDDADEARAVVADLDGPQGGEP